MNRYLYEKALGYYTSNASEIVDDILDNNNWSNVEIWEPFETWNVENVKELVDNLYKDFLEIKKSKKNKKSKVKDKYLYYEIFFIEDWNPICIKYPAGLPIDKESIALYASQGQISLGDYNNIDTIKQITGTDYILYLINATK